MEKSTKRDHLVPIVFGVMRTRKGKPKPTCIKILLDSGASASIIKSDFVKNLKKIKKPTTSWNTIAGKINTDATCKLEFKLPEFYEKKVINYQAHVAAKVGNYDMIIGRDLLTELKMDFLFSSQTTKWDEISIPMKSIDATLEDSFYISDSRCIDAATKRMKQILDAKYEPADLKEIVNSCTHLDNEQQQSLQLLLNKYSNLFDGTLGHWSGDDYNIELKEGAKPYHARAFPIPKVHEEKMKTECRRLCETGVLKEVNRSEWGAPTFIIPKKDQTV